MAVQKKLYTIAEFEPFADSSENRDRLLELVNGEIFEKMPTEEHGVIALNIGSALKNHVKLNDIAGRVGVEVRHRNPTDSHNARIPDVSFRYTDEPAVKKGSVDSMPDLAVEILSPDDEYQDLLEKAHFYLLNGSELVWLTFPKSRTIGVCTLMANGEISVRTLNINDVLDGGDVLPGFRMAVKDIFDV
jgi:Uma2 family endonuclease